MSYPVHWVYNWVIFKLIVLRDCSFTYGAVDGCVLRLICHWWLAIHTHWCGNISGIVAVDVLSP